MEAELAKFGAHGITIFALIIIHWVIKKVLNDIVPVQQSLEKSLNELTTYLKKRNGSLEANDKIITEQLNKITDKLSKIC